MASRKQASKRGPVRRSFVRSFEERELRQKRKTGRVGESRRRRTTRRRRRRSRGRRGAKAVARGSVGVGMGLGGIRKSFEARWYACMHAHMRTARGFFFRFILFFKFCVCLFVREAALASLDAEFVRDAASDTWRLSSSFPPPRCVGEKLVASHFLTDGRTPVSLSIRLSRHFFVCLCNETRRMYGV